MSFFGNLDEVNEVLFQLWIDVESQIDKKYCNVTVDDGLNEKIIEIVDITSFAN